MSEIEPWLALCGWLRGQHEEGNNVEQLLNACTRSGWDQESSIKAVERALGIRLEPALPTPQPHVEPGHLLGAGDRQVDVLAQMAMPSLMLLGNLLSLDECSDLIAAARSRMNPVKLYDIATGNLHVSPSRSNTGMFFRRGENALVQRLEQRLATMLNWPVEWGEGLQVLRYGIGEQYKPHFDYFTGAPNNIANRRVATVVMYLNQPEAGGATVFPDVHFEVLPKPGNAVFFSYARPYSTTLTRHGGSPVLAGEKWIATKWLHANTYDEPKGSVDDLKAQCAAKDRPVRSDP